MGGHRRHPPPRGTDLISATRRGGQSLGGDSFNGGITAYAGTRGIVVFVNQRGGGSDLYYRNNHTGNIDDLAHAPASSPIQDVVTSARANFVAFTSTYDREAVAQVDAALAALAVDLAP